MQQKLREIGLLTDQEHHNYEAIQETLLSQIDYSHVLTGANNELTLLHINKLNLITVQGLESEKGFLRQTATENNVDIGGL